MSRSVSWRRTCPGVVSRRAEQALQATVYILHQTGPTGFLLKEEGSERKLKVLLGDPHTCSCSTFKKEKELCRHILWVLLKRFRVPQENPITFQLGLVEREINEVLHGYLRRQQAQIDQSDSRAGPRDETAAQKDIGIDDVCPICREELLSKPSPVTYCKFGCGKSVHIKCMKIWADHQRSKGEKLVKCPLCRKDFGSFQDLCKELHASSSRRLHVEKAALHLGVACNHCRLCPIDGKCYRCTVCAGYHLCHACFSSNQVHMLHSFEFRKHPSQPWQSAIRTYPSPHNHDHGSGSDSAPLLPAGLIGSLQRRSLTESDYELLLQLDRPRDTTQSATRGVPERILNSFHVEPIDSDNPLLLSRAHCQVCMNSYRRGEWVRKLPCKHQFHRDCIDGWLQSAENTTCPIDGHLLYDPAKEKQRRRKLLSKRKGNEGASSKRRTVGSIARAMSRQNSGSSDEDMEFTISGQSIGIGSVCNKPEVPTARHGTKPPKLPSKISRAMGINQTPGSNHSTSGGLLPKISNSGICSSSRRSIVESSKRLLKRRQSLSPPQLSDKDMSETRERLLLAPVCSGYATPTEGGSCALGFKAPEPLPRTPLHSPPTGRIRKGSLATKPDSNLQASRLDSSLCVSSFKLRPVSTIRPIVVASQL